MMCIPRSVRYIVEFILNFQKQFVFLIKINVRADIRFPAGKATFMGSDHFTINT
ncbi:hypothetical protein D3C87_1238690 [compost metagenome]